MRLANRVALITGAAQGLGAAIARLFAAEGACVILGDVDRERGQSTADDIGSRALFVPLDVRRDGDWRAIVAAGVGRFGGIDILVNNAGIFHAAAIEDMIAEEAERVLAINVLGPMLGAKHVVPVMKRARRGVIVNISSVDGLRGCNGISAYSASKWALRGLTKSQAYELGPAGIRVCSVHPGGMDTRMGNPAGCDKAELDIAYCVVPLQRIADADEVARVILFVASDDASYVTGAEVAADGGWSAGYFQPMLPGAPGSQHPASLQVGP